MKWNFPLETEFSNSIWLFQFKWTFPLDMGFSTWNELFQFEWTFHMKWIFPIEMDFSTLNGLFQLKWNFSLEMDFSNWNGLFQLKKRKKEFYLLHSELKSVLNCIDLVHFCSLFLSSIDVILKSHDSIRQKKV